MVGVALLLLTGCSAGPITATSTTAAESGLDQDTTTQSRAVSNPEAGDYAAALADELGITDPPEVSPVREVAPDDEGLRIQTQCMIDRGWPYREDQDGGYVLELRVEQEASFNLDSYVCQLQYPVAERYRQPWGRTQHEARYAYLTEIYLPCVRAQGYSVAEPPSLEVFVEDEASGRPWIPSSGVLPQVLADVPERWASWEEFDSVCPQGTPLDELYPPLGD